MKKLFTGGLVAALIVIVVAMGCTKTGTNGPQVPLPDISDFTITGASTFSAGTPATVYVYCTTLGAGNYKVSYDLSGSNTLTSQNATLNIANNGGSFNTASLPNAGQTYLTINSISNVNGGGTAFTSGNTYTISDSTGQMAAQVGSSTYFNATDVLATVTGTKLTIRGVMTEPYESSMTLNINTYTHTNGIINFSNYNVPEIASAQYQRPGGGLISANGTIRITSVSPFLMGTYSFRAMDSTDVINGTFTLLPPNP